MGKSGRKFDLGGLMEVVSKLDTTAVDGVAAVPEVKLIPLADIVDNKATVSSLTGQMLILILEALAFGLGISVLLSFLLSKTMVTPLQRLTEGAMRVAEGDFSRKIEVDSQDEIGVLTNTFNDMAGQLRRTLRQGRFWHDSY